MVRGGHRATHYRKDWEIQFPWVEEVKGDNSSAKCKLCNSIFKINSGGKSQVTIHSKTKGHSERAKHNNTLDMHFSDNPTRISKVFSHEDEVIKSEILWAIKCCVSNYSFNSNENIGDIFRNMFPDSKIAANYGMSYTKLQYILEFGLAPYILENLCDDFRDTAFTFKFDESTNIQVKKQYDAHVQYHSKKFGRVVNHYCGSLFVGHCNSDQLKDHFFDFGKKLLWNVNYLLHIGMDGPWVNLKFERILEDELKQVYGKPILKIGTCSLHPIHTAFSKGLDAIDFDFDKFAQELHFFFKYSSARREDFTLTNLESELEIRFMLRHVISRWVSLKKACVRINEQWDHLYKYFVVFLPKQANFRRDIEKTERYQYIISVLKSKKSLIYINFAIYIAGYLESYLIPMESAEPKIHLLYTNLSDLFYKLMSCFVKKKLLLDSDNYRKEACELGSLNLDDPKSLKSIHEMGVGTRAKFLIANLESIENLDIMKVEFLSCYKIITKYLQDNMPHQSILLRDLTCIQPKQRQKTRSPAAIRRVAIEIAKILMNTKLTTLTPESYADLIMTEYKIYQSECFDIPPPDTDDEDNPKRIEEYWNFIGKIENADGTLRFKTLTELVFICLSISHGNADPERGFSQNKHLLDGKHMLSEESIVAIRLVKQAVILYGGILKFPITRRLITLVKNSHAAYERAREAKKTEEMFSKKVKEMTAEEAASIEKVKDQLGEIDQQILNEQITLNAAKEILNDAQSALEKSLSCKKVKKEEVAKANALLKVAIDNSKKSTDIIAELNKAKSDLMKKQKPKKKNR